MQKTFIIPLEVFEKLKQKAFDLKTDGLLSEQEALDKIAQGAGLSNWGAFKQTTLKSHRTASGGMT